MDNFKYDDEGLRNLWKAIAESNLKVKIGILSGSGKNERPLSSMTNAEIGAVHEFGSIGHKIPKRSFLRMPLERYGRKAVENAKRAFLFAIQKGKSMLFFDLLGIEAVAIVTEAFKTSGFGSWAPLKRRAGTPLVDTGQLMRSISYKVILSD